MMVMLAAFVGSAIAGVLTYRELARKNRRIAQLELLVHQLRCGDLFQFFDGELAPERAEAFRAHLVDCPACQAGLHDLVQLEAGISALAQPRSPR